MLQKFTISCKTYAFVIAWIPFPLQIKEDKQEKLQFIQRFYLNVASLPSTGLRYLRVPSGVIWSVEISKQNSSVVHVHKQGQLCP